MNYMVQDDNRSSLNNAHAYLIYRSCQELRSCGNGKSESVRLLCVMVRCEDNCEKSKASWVVFAFTEIDFPECPFAELCIILIVESKMLMCSFE